MQPMTPQQFAQKAIDERGGIKSKFDKDRNAMKRRMAARDDIEKIKEEKQINGEYEL